MIVLGLNHGELNSSAAIVKDGQVIAGVAEERFNRQKKTKDFPFQSANYCLERASLSGLEDCDYVAQAWQPGATWRKYNPSISGVRVRREDYFYSVPDNLYRLTERSNHDWALMSFPDGANLPPLYFVQHHRAHAANAFYLSPFDEAAILTCDWRGELECTTFGVGRGNSIEVLGQHEIPNSLGMFYAAYTELLGYTPDSDEWKVMALSAFDVDSSSYLEKIRSTYRLLDDGGVEFDQSYYKGAVLDQPKLYTPKLIDLLGGRQGVPGSDPDDWHMMVAQAMQKASEEIATHFLEHLFSVSGCENVVLSGGFFMNCVYNGKVVEETSFSNVFISHSPADLGNSIGAALYVTHHLLHEARYKEFSSSFIGPSFTDAEIENSLQRRRIHYQSVENLEAFVAELLSKGEIVAVFNGRMEFGERSLGNRSILADPRSPQAKDHINARIKYREKYRPFAPAVLHEKSHRYFQVPEGYMSNYMEKVVSVREEFREKLPAITHVDGSGRLQTVRREHNPVFHGIISQFEEITSYPVVLNTSFNLNGEPIVLSPSDALSTFYSSGLEHLFLGNYYVTKCL